MLFSQGPLSGAGNNVAGNGTQAGIMYGLTLLVLIPLIVLSFYSARLNLRYQKGTLKYSNFAFKTNGPGYLIGSIIIFASFFRILIFTNVLSGNTDVYPRLGELIPLHGSRIVLFPIVFICFAGHKIRRSNGNFLFLMISITTALIALSQPDLSGQASLFDGLGETRGGSNSFVFGDYFLIHAGNFAFPGTILILYRPKLTLKVFLYAFLTIIIYLVTIFIIDSILAATLNPNNDVQRLGIGNGAYLSFTQYNHSLGEFVPPLTHYPGALFTYIILFSISIYIVGIAYYYSDLAFVKRYVGYEREMNGDFINLFKIKILNKETSIFNYKNWTLKSKK